MFVRQIQVEAVREDGSREVCLLRWIDNFAMRNFTNDTIFDDTLPLSDGLMEIGLKVPIELLQSAMQDWFYRKMYLKRGEKLVLTELPIQGAF